MTCNPNTLFHGAKPPARLMVKTDLIMETLTELAKLTAEERRVLSVHMDAAQREARDAGTQRPLILELIQLAHITAS